MISCVPRILLKASTMVVVVAPTPAKDLHILNICRIFGNGKVKKCTSLQTWQNICTYMYLGFRCNVTLILLPELIVLSKAELVGQIQDEVRATMRLPKMFMENVIKRFPRLCCRKGQKLTDPTHAPMNHWYCQLALHQPSDLFCK